MEERKYTAEQAMEFSRRGDEVFGAFLDRLPHADKRRLCCGQRLDADRYAQILHAAATYISRCLGEKRTLAAPELLGRLEAARFTLPNYSPLGPIVPMREQALEFNLLHKSVAAAFTDFNLDGVVDVIDCPINVRMVFGAPAPNAGPMPYTSSKLHCDAWAGVPVDAVIVVLPLFGDIENITIVFGEMARELEIHAMRGMGDYDEGREFKMANPYRDASLEHGHIYFSDNRLMHRTVRRKKEGVRLSIDFRFRRTDLGYRALVPEPVGPEANTTRIPYRQWLDIGSESMMVFDDRMARARDKLRAPTTNLYGVEHRLVDLSGSMHQDTRKLYDATAAGWVRNQPLSLSDFTGRPPTLALLEPVSGLCVLDLGCGEGYCARQLRQRGAAEVVGIDLSERMIAGATAQETREPLGIRYAQGDATDLRNHPDSRFDRVVAVFLFNYLDVDQTRRAMKEVRRVLAPGGRFVFAVPHPSLPFLRKPEPPFFFEVGSAGYFSGRNTLFPGRIWKRDGTHLDVQMCHKTVEDYFDALRAAGFANLPVVRELRVTPEILAVDPAFFGPLGETPLHLAVAVER